MTQTPRPVAALRTRLDPVYTDRFELPHDRNPLHPDRAHPRFNGFLDGLSDVFSVMVHETDGSVARYRARKWVNDYHSATGTGGGPQLVIWPDGTVISLVELPYRTTHGNYVNDRSIGVESGHGNDGRFGDIDVAPDLRVGQPPRQGWRELSSNAEDIVGSTSAKYYRLDAPLHNDPDFESEVVVAAWSTTSYSTPARELPGTLRANQYKFLVEHEHGTAPPVPTLMLFPEAQYRSWALLARYLAEALLVPRNFPVLPHTRRDFVTADIFRKIVLADQNFDRIVAGLRGSYLGINLQFVPADFTDPAQADSLRAHFGCLGTSTRPPDPPEVAEGQIAAAIGYNNSAMNVAWKRLFDFYRGFHGHGFSGNSLAGKSDHDCPGQMFDWHRFAREVWDWWWYPFDFDPAHATTAVGDREYRRATGTTPLVEYFFYDTAAGAPDPYLARASAPGGIQGAAASPLTFHLDERSPVYALANGELIAARFPATGDNVSMAFVLTRHELWHRADRRAVDRSAAGVEGPDAAHGGAPDLGRIDYNLDPTPVYSLVMHLGRPDGMSFDAVSDHNPDWLNRVLIRKKECDVALPPTANGSLAPGFAGVPAADFTQPPGGVRRPTPVEAWRMDQRRYGAFLSALKAGDVAVAPYQQATDQYGPTPMRIVLGDFLGTAGVVRRQAGTSTFGARIEIFSTANIDPAFFTSVTNQTSWNPPAGIAHPALQYSTEWARKPEGADAAALTAMGVDPLLVPWWSEVQQAQTFDVRTPAAVRLPLFGNVFHYSPLDFMRWINDVTWASEWPKYRIPGLKAAPRGRRV